MSIADPTDIQAETSLSELTRWVAEIAELAQPANVVMV